MTHPKPATIIASLALFFSLGGAGVAASRYIRSAATFSNLSEVYSSPTNVSNGQTGFALATCPLGSTAVAGGFKDSSPRGNVATVLIDVRRGNGWEAAVTDDGAASFTLQAQVVCIS